MILENINWTDVINGIWELVGAIFIIPSIMNIIKTKVSNGITWHTQTFFLSWGLWNVFFYPYNGFTYSFIGGLVLAVVNIVWLILILKHRVKKPEISHKSMLVPGPDRGRHVRFDNLTEEQVKLLENYWEISNSGPRQSRAPH